MDNILDVSCFNIALIDLMGNLSRLVLRNIHDLSHEVLYLGLGVLLSGSGSYDNS
jgi:hypothetical protein